MLFKIDFTRPHLYEDVVTLNQGNLSTNNTLRCRIATGGNDDVTGASIVCTFVINGKQIFESGKVVDGPRGIVDVIFPSEALVVGENTLEFLVNRVDGSVAQSPVIKYRVWQGLTTDEGVRADSNYPLLVELINSTNEASNKANSALNKANSMISDITDAIDNAYRSANDADIATSNANTKIEEVETAKTEMIKKVDTSIVTMKSDVEVAKNEMASKTDEKIADVDRALAAGTKDLEIKESRRDMDGVEHDTLKLRLESDLKKGKVIEETKEGTYLSFNDTVRGIVSDVEILGNTVQNASNLADIKSSCIPNGDGIFKMSILSCGENLWNAGSMEHGKTYYTKLPIGQFTFSLVASSTTSARVGIFVVNEDNSALSSKVITNNVLTNITFTNSKVQNVGFKIGGWDSGATLQSTKDIQLQEGTVATPYTPYQETRCDIKLPCQLEKVGDLADKLYFDKFENAWCVLDNIEDGVSNSTGWGASKTDSNTCVFVKTLPKYSKGNNKIIGAISNKFPAMPADTQWATDSESIAINSSSSLLVRINKTTIGYTDEETRLQKFLDWLKLNPFNYKIHSANPQKIVLPQSEQIKLNSFANKTHIYTISGDVDATVKATVSKSLASTVQANTEEISKINNMIGDIQGLKESQDFAYETDKGYLVCKDTQNGVVKDLKIYGKSLVNKSKIKTTSFEGRIINLFSDSILNGFTIITDTIKNTASKGIAISITDINGVATYPLIQKPNTTGKSVWFFDKQVKEISIYLQLDDYGADKATVDNIMILEGDHRSNLPNGYFEGIASVGNGDEIEVLSCNENVLDVEDFLKLATSYTFENGIYTVKANTLMFSQGYKIKPFNRITLSCKAKIVENMTNFRLRLVYTDGTFNESNMTSLANDFTLLTVTSNPNKTIDKIAFNWSAIGTLQIKDFQLTLTDSYIGDVERKQDKKTILFKDIDNTWKPVTNLRGIDENNCDIVDTVNNKFDENITEVVFNGDSTENWSFQKTENGKSQFTMSAKRTGIKPNSKILSDKYNNITSSQFTNMEVGVFNGSAWGLVINDPSVTDVQSLKAKLQSNNIKVNVQLLEGKTYEINPIFPNSYENETMISFGSGVIAPYASWKITSSLPNFVQNIEDRVCRLENDAYKVNLANFTVALNMLDMKARLESLEAPIN